MASDKRNALAELAERLDPRNCHRNDFLVAVESAQRIIAELANVETPYDLVGLIGKCRVIAEEGANDGN